MANNVYKVYKDADRQHVDYVILYLKTHMGRDQLEVDGLYYDDQYTNKVYMEEGHVESLAGMLKDALFGFNASGISGLGTFTGMSSMGSYANVTVSVPGGSLMFDIGPEGEPEFVEPS